MKHTWNMHTKVLVLCLGITLIALISQTIIFRDTSSQIIYQQAKEESFNSLQNMQDDIYGFIKTIENGLINIYNEKEFIKDLKAEMDLSDMRDKYYREAYNIGARNFESSDWVVALYLYNSDHEIISTYRRATTPKHNYPKDIYSDCEQYNAQIVKEYVESGDATMLISSYYNKSREADIVRFVLKLYNNSNIQNKIGYVVCDVDRKSIKTMMEKYSPDQEVFMWLQPLGDRSMLSIGTLDQKDEDSYVSFQKEIQEGNENLGETLESGNRVFFQVGQSKYNLGAYSLMPQSLLEENQRALTKNLIMIAGIMLIVAAAAAYLVSKSLTRPLEKMTQTVKKIRDGDTRLRIQRMKDDEIGELAQNFNEMLDQIESLISREYETKLLLNRAEYKALQAQINPHFLYNTLDAMTSIAEIQGCRQVSALCQSLSNIFRYSLDMKNPYSNVAKEIVHLKNYIYVMSVRMQDEVEYQFEVQDEVLKDSIPRISIQPLVENALNHGLRNCRGKKKVLIQASAVGDNLQIVVSDNGVGIPREKLRTLLDERDEKKAEKGTSIGINNIHMRMKMLYGEVYGLTVESEIGCGTRVILTIPRRGPKEEFS